MRLRVLVVAFALGVMCAGPAFCQTLQFIAALTGAAQSPPNSSNGVGTAVLTVDLGVATFPMRVEALPYSVDQLMWWFTDVTPTGGTMRVAWDKVMASVPFKILN